MSGTEPYKPLETSETERPKKIRAILDYRKIIFTREYTGQIEQRWEVPLPVNGWSMAMHPPSNVLAVTPKTESLSYVTSEWFNNTYPAMLTGYAHV